MDPQCRLQLQQNLRRLAAAHVAAMKALEATSAMLHAEFDLTLASRDAAILRSQRRTRANWPLVDRTSMSVVYRGRSCFLGNTLPLRFIERLLLSPNQYVSHEQLQDDVWNALRSPAAVRSVVKELRAKLRRAGMSSLAEAIDGQVAGHYALILERGS